MEICTHLECGQKTAFTLVFKYLPGEFCGAKEGLAKPF
jgi:hypothetical protein